MDSREFREAWQAQIKKLEPNRPSVGKRVRVVEGRKHLGKEGEVFWHGIDKYDSNRYYKTAAQQMMSEAMGRMGYRVGIRTDEGETFFTGADKVEVIEEAK